MVRRLIVLLAVMAVGACTLDKQDAPSLSGPSELGLSLQVTATPDVITQDGQSQSTVSVIARDANSQPVRGLTMRVETSVDGTIVDFGTLSSRTISTGSDGRANVTYQAPAAPPPTQSSDTVVQVVVTPVGTNYENTTFRTVAIRLARPGVLLPPNSKPNVSFLVSPAAPKEGDKVVFDASASTDDGSIVSYSWSFGDGGTGTGVKTTHTYTVAGQYSVTLSVTDNLGATTLSSQQTVNVGAGTGPTAVFSNSPTTPVAGTATNFNANASKAATGHSIVGYDWDFGDGSSGSGATISHTYAQSGGYNVTLIVTDDQGRTSVLTQTVSVATSAPQAAFTSTPGSPHVGDVISFDASSSSVAIIGRTIVSYQWDFLDGTTASGVTASHAFSTSGPHNVVLKVTDNTGQIGTITRTLSIQP